MRPTAVTEIRAGAELGRDLAARLITLRRKRGFATASAAADHLGIQRHTYLHWERGTRDLRISTLGEILEKFDATLLELLGLPMGKRNPKGFQSASSTEESL